MNVPDAEAAWQEWQPKPPRHWTVAKAAFLAGFAAGEAKNQSALGLMRSLSINPLIPDGLRIMMKESLDR